LNEGCYLGKNILSSPTLRGYDDLISLLEGLFVAETDCDKVVLILCEWTAGTFVYFSVERFLVGKNSAALVLAVVAIAFAIVGVKWPVVKLKAQSQFPTIPPLVERIAGSRIYRRVIYAVIAIALLASVGSRVYHHYYQSFPVEPSSARIEAEPERPATTPVGSTQRIFTDRKPKELLDFYKDVSPIQADDLMKPYVGRWMTVEGKALTNPVDAGSGGSQFMIVDDDGAHCTCTFASQWRQDVKTVRIGDRVKAQGKISEGQNGATLYLIECDLSPIERELGAHTARVADENNNPLKGAEIYFIRSNGVHSSKAVSDDAGVAEIPTLGEVVSLYCALDGFYGYYQKEYDPDRSLRITLRKNPHGGSVIFPDGTGYIPGLSGRLNPILDTEARTYLYAENISIDDGKPQPTTFVPNRPMILEDLDGHRVEIAIVSILHASSLIDYRRLR
jgi:hypothetical protein